MEKSSLIVVLFCIMVYLIAVPVSAIYNGNYYVVAPNVSQGATVFIGEQGLDITRAMDAANAEGIQTSITTIGWWASAADIYNTAPTTSVETATRQEAFTVTQAEFDGFEGQWYLLDPNADNTAKLGAGAVFNVKAPKLDISIRNTGQDNADVSGKAVPIGAKLQFQIGTNMYSVLNPANRKPVYNLATQDGYLDIVVKNPSGTILTQLYNTSGSLNTLKSLNISTQPYTWGKGPGIDYVWNSAALTTTGEKAYPAGTYVVNAQSKLNNMQTNYLVGGAQYTGRTVSETRTITLVPETLKITANKDSVVRGGEFAVTVTGIPSTYYNLWVKGTGSMDETAYDNAPPMITPYQDNVIISSADTGRYPYANSGGCEITVSSDAYVKSYAQIKSSTSGVRTVGFYTTYKTKAQIYTIHVEKSDGTCPSQSNFKIDEVAVTVEKGVPPPSPTISGINPATGFNTTSVWIWNLAGTNFLDGATVKLNRTGYADITGTSVTVLSPTQIECAFNLTNRIAGSYKIVVTNIDGQKGVLANGFTVIARQASSSKIGIFRPSTHLFYLDTNGNGAWNGAAVDKSYNFGITGDIPVSGDWNNDGISEIGVFRNSTHLFYLDYNGNGAWNGASIDRQYNFGIAGDIPVTGDWNLDGRTEIGVFRNSTHLFYLDYNGNGVWNGAVTDRSYNFGISGDIPVSGDWNIDGRTEIGVFRPSTHLFYLDYNGNGVWNGGVTDRSYNFGITGDMPISGDWNNDGKSEIGVFRNSTHLFYLDYNGNGAWNGAVTDKSYNFGITGDIPVSGKWG